MPLAHLNLTVSHLPTSTSFFLSSLQPLGYRYVGRTDNSVGFGPDPGEHADFWISEETPSVPAGAAHVAFPAPSRAAVNAFFIAALKAGGHIHGEPRLRDPEQGYFSAAVVDFDGNSVEAVHRPSLSSSSGPAEMSTPTTMSGEPALAAMENVPASVKKSRSIATTREKTKTVGSEAVAAAAAAAGSPVVKASRPSEHALERQTTSRTVSQASSTTTITPHRPALALSGSHHVSVKDKDDTSGKAVVGTLIGAAAGAAIAYAMCKGDSQSEAAAAHAVPAFPSFPSPSHCSESKSIHKPSSSAQILQPEPECRPQKTIEAVPSRGGMSDYARSALSKNPRASTIFDGLDRCSKLLGGNGGDDQPGKSQLQRCRPTSSRRHSMTGSIVPSERASSEMNLDMTNLPIRAIEGVPSEYGHSNGNRSESSRAYVSYMHDPATPISSFVERNRNRDDSDAISLRSSSTIKPSKTTNRLPVSASASSSRVSSSSARRRSSSRSVRAVDDISIGSRTPRAKWKSGNGNGNGDKPSPSVCSAAKVPLPSSAADANGSSMMSRSSIRSSKNAHTHGHGSGSTASVSRSHASSFRSARDIPLPASDVTAGSGGPVSREKGRGGGGGDGGSKASLSTDTRSKKKQHKSTVSSRSKYESSEPLRPSNSASQVSSSSSVAGGRSRMTSRRERR